MDAFCWLGVSIHTSRGWSGYREPSCRPSLRFLGPTPALGAASGILWGTAVCFHAAVLGLAVPAMVAGQQLAAVAVLLAVLSAVTLAAVAVVLHLDCAYDPDWPTEPPLPAVALVAQPERPTRLAWVVWENFSSMQHLIDFWSVIYLLCN